MYVTDPATGQKISVRAEWELVYRNGKLLPFKPFPERLIVPTSDLLAEFRQAVGSEIEQRDVATVVDAVVSSLLYEENPDDIEKMVQLPDFNRMRSTAFFKDASKAQAVRTASWQLAAQLYERLKQYGAYQHGEFPYIFACFLGQDMVFDLLPH